MTVRREKVVLDLQDNFTAGMLRAAAATKLLDRELNTVSGSTSRSLVNSGRDIDRYSGRLRLLADLALSLGPAFVPIGAVAIPAVTALASGLGFATLATGAAVVAFQGFGDALTAVNKAALEPTEANLEAARLKMSQISPEARALVTQLSDLRPVFMELKAAAGEDLFPGVQRGITRLLDLLPQAEAILQRVGDAAGDIFAAGSDSLASDRWAEFFAFLENEARPTMMDLAHTAGDLTHGLAELWMAFQPLNGGALGWIADAANGFDRWATGLEQTEGFQDFLDYLRTSGPQVADTLGAVAGAAADLLVAVAPLGGPTLRAVESLANALSLIADSFAGTPLLAAASAMGALNLAGRALGPTVDRARTSVKGLRDDLKTMGQVGIVSWARSEQGAVAYAQASERVRANIRGLAKTGALVGGLAFATSGLADEMGLANTATLALAGSTAGPWGAAAGGAIGLLLDWKARQDALSQSADNFRATLDAQTGAITNATRQMAAEQLTSEEFRTAADAAGLSAEQLAAAVTAGGDAYQYAMDKLSAYQDQQAGWQGWDEFFDPTPDGGNDALAVQRLQTKLDDMRGSVAQAKEEWTFMAPVVDAANAAVARGVEPANEYASATGAAARATESFTSAQQRLNNFLTKRKTLRDYEAALDNVRGALKENGRTLDINTEKGRANEAALDDLVQSVSDVAGQMKRSDRQAFMTTARKQILEAAHELGATKAQIDAVRRQLNRLDGTTARTYIVTYHRQVMERNNLGGRQDFASGGFVRGPGGPRDDMVSARLSNGEFVVNALATRRHRALLEAINSRRYADGGYVASARWERMFTKAAASMPPAPANVSGDRYMADHGAEFARMSAALLAIQQQLATAPERTGRAVGETWHGAVRDAARRVT